MHHTGGLEVGWDGGTEAQDHGWRRICQLIRRRQDPQKEMSQKKSSYQWQPRLPLSIFGADPQCFIPSSVVSEIVAAALHPGQCLRCFSGPWELQLVFFPRFQPQQQRKRPLSHWL